MLGNKDLSVAWCCVTHTCAHIRTYACVRANVVASVFHSACFHVCFFLKLRVGAFWFGWRVCSSCEVFFFWLCVYVCARALSVADENAQLELN